jgi:hypothetical protein
LPRESSLLSFSFLFYSIISNFHALALHSHLLDPVFQLSSLDDDVAGGSLCLALQKETWCVLGWRERERRCVST